MSPIETATRGAIVELINSEIIDSGPLFQSVVADILRVDKLTKADAAVVERTAEEILEAVRRWKPKGRKPLPPDPKPTPRPR